VPERPQQGVPEHPQQERGAKVQLEEQLEQCRQQELQELQL